jgi:ribose transport system substrate-binding protein
MAVAGVFRKHYWISCKEQEVIMKRTQAILIGICAVVLMMVCATGTLTAQKRIMVGMVQIGTDNPFWIAEVKGAQEAARRFGFDVKVTSGQGDLNKQVQAFEDLVNAKVSVITLNAIDGKAFGPAMAKANAAKIPVVSLHTWIDGCAFKLGFDEWYTGRMNGQHAVDLLTAKYGKPKGTVAILQGMLGQDVNGSRDGGFEEILKKYSDIKVVARDPTDWDPKKAADITANYLTAYPNLDLIYGLSDSLTVPAANIVKRAGKLDKVILVSVDGTESGLQAVKQGLQKSTVLLAPQYTGFWYAYSAYETAKGVKFPKNLLIRGVLVTPDNIDAMLQLAKDQDEKIQSFPFEMSLQSIADQYSMK